MSKFRKQRVNVTPHGNPDDMQLSLLGPPNMVTQLEHVFRHFTGAVP
jgi:hypothetical protein